MRFSHGQTKADVLFIYFSDDDDDDDDDNIHNKQQGGASLRPVISLSVIAV
mgnify:CR=1 FL=1